MDVVILEDAAGLGSVAADLIAELVASDLNPVIGLATGSSPLPIYRELAARVADGRLSLARAQAFLLDEYVGLPLGHPETYREVIRRDFVDHVDLDAAAVHSPDGLAADLRAECAAYEDKIAAAGGVDLQLLGIGANGHIAFNEPATSLASRTRVEVLTPQTRQDNARFFDGDLDAVPTHGITQGIGTIMDARHLVLIATGEGKAEAVRQLVEGAVSARWPATVLQLHARVTVLVDSAAASRLELADYYRDLYAHKLDPSAF